MTERTLVLIKPDAVKRGLVGEVLARFERKGLTIDAMVLRTMDGDLADRHYAEHVDKAFYPPLKEFMTGGPLVALILAGTGRSRWCAPLSARPTAGWPRRERSGATSRCPTGKTWCTPPTAPTAPSGSSRSGSPSWLRRGNRVSSTGGRPLG